MDFYIGLNKSITYLPNIVNLTDYEVAATDIYIPTSLLHSGHAFEIRVSEDGGVSFPRTIEYSMPESFYGGTKAMADLSEKLKPYASIGLTEDGHMEFYSKSAETQILFPSSLSRVFGLQNQLITTKKVTSSAILSYDVLYERIIIFCNFVPPYWVNGKYMPCLYLGPPAQSFEKGRFLKTTNGQFYSLGISFFNVFC